MDFAINFLIIFSIFEIFVGLIWFYKKSKKVNELLIADGEILELKKSTQISGNFVNPVVQFRDRYSNKQQFISNTRVTADKYKVGDKVQVLYNKENSKEAVIKNVVLLWILPFAITLGGFLTLSIMLILKYFVFK